MAIKVLILILKVVAAVVINVELTLFLVWGVGPRS